MAGDDNFEGELWPNKGGGNAARSAVKLTADERQRRRVAVIEDEDTIREGICYALTRNGYEPLPFDDGLTAWEHLSETAPDLVILDIGLPRMDGLELCRRLRTRSDRLPIIFVTSREDEFDRVLGLEIGADDYLCKPFSMRELLARVKVLLRRAGYVDGRASRRIGRWSAGASMLDPVRLAATWRERPCRSPSPSFCCSRRSCDGRAP